MKEKLVFVRVTLETETFDGTDVTASTTSNWTTLQKLSCSPGEWFEDVIRSLHSELAAKLKAAEKETKP